MISKKEIEIQRALGHLKTYCGYVKEASASTQYFDVYEVEDVTKEGATEQVEEMRIRAAAEVNISLTLEFVVEENNPRHVQSHSKERVQQSCSRGKYARRRRNPKN